MDKPYVIGITGGIGCGKTAATDFLSRHGALIIDADVESRRLTAPDGDALPKIREAFGPAVFLPDGSLNRRLMGEIVFEHEDERRLLEGIIHPMVQHSMVLQIRKAGEEGVPFLFLSVPLLFETGMDALCDETWCLTLSEEDQIERVMERDGLTRSEVEARIRSQMPMEDKAARANVVIRTNRPIEATHLELAALLKELKRRFG